ncbi:MAG: hypothetical protein JSV49_12430 [Thermoplasmata archaeon]|nr:MAG: hypothetical protein JSV49_12430 [Thermoplasmata archaeon]
MQTVIKQHSILIYIVINLICISLLASPIGITGISEPNSHIESSPDNISDDKDNSVENLADPESSNMKQSRNSPRVNGNDDPVLEQISSGVWTNTWNFTNTSAYTTIDVNLENGIVELIQINDSKTFEGATDFSAGKFDQTELDSESRLKLSRAVEPRYFITDKNNHRNVEVNDEGTWKWQYGVNATPGFTAGMLNSPGSVKILPSSNILIADSDNHRVIEINRSNGNSIDWSFGVVGVAGSGPNELNTPTDASYIDTDYILVTDSLNHQVVEINTATTKKGWTYGTGNPGTGPNKLDTPASAIRLTNGTILIADRGNERVLMASSSKMISWSYGTPGSPGYGANQLDSPGFIYPLYNGNFLVTDTGNHRVIELNKSGTIVWTYGITNVSGSGENYLNLPERAYPLASGNYLIIDSGNHRILEVTRTNRWVWQYGINESSGSGLGELDTPVDVVHIPGGYAKSGEYISDVIDAGSQVFWNNFNFNSSVPQACDQYLFFRAGDSATAGDSSWTVWDGPYSNPSQLSFSSSGLRYIQFKIELSTSDISQTARFTSITFDFSKYDASKTGIVILSEFVNDKITEFVHFNPIANLNGQNNNYFYSLDSGINWYEIPSNYDLKGLDPTQGKIQFKVELSSSDSIRSPILERIQLRFTRIGELNRIDIDPSTLNISAGNFHVFSVKGFDDLGNEVDVSPEWSTNVGIMTGNVFTAQTLVGTGFVNATVDSIVGSCNVSITPAGLDHMKIIPFEINITAGETHEFEAIGYDRYGNIIDCVVSWSSSIGSMDGNLFHAGYREGDGIIMARNGSIIGIALVHVKFDIQHPPPQITKTISNQVYPEDSPPWALDLNPYEFDTEDTGEALNWYVTGKNNDLFQISGEYSADDKLTFLPVPNAAGNTEITLWLEDSTGFTDSQNIWVNLTPVNDEPRIIPIPDLNCKKGEDYFIDFGPYIYDIDTPITDLSLFFISPMETNIYNYLTLDGFKATVNYPAEFEGNQEIIIITVSDGTKFSSDLFLINFTSNSPPVFNSDNEQLPESAEFPEDTNYTFVDNLNDYFTDSEGSNLNFMFLSEYIRPIFEHGYLNLTNKHPDWFGTDRLIIRAYDAEKAFKEVVIEVTVTPVNDAPRISALPELFVHYETKFEFDISPFVIDPDNRSSELTITTNDLNNIEQKDNRPLVLILNYSKVMSGFQLEIMYTVSDGLADSTQTQLISISDNFPPVLEKIIRPIQFPEDTSLIDHINLNHYFSDPEKKEITYGVVNESIHVNIRNNGYVDFSAPLNWYGQENVMFIARDSKNSTNYATVEITVTPVNDKPEIMSIPNQIGQQETHWVLDLKSYVYDPDDDINELSFKLDQNTGYATLYGSTILFYYVDKTTEALTVEVSDGAESSSTSFVVEFTGITISEEITEPESDDRSFEIYMAFIYILILIITINSGGIAYFYMKYKGKFKLEDLFVIHANGNLISHVGGSSRLYTDNEILSGMLTAIQDFIKDGFSESSESASDDWGLDHLKFGDRNIFIERNDYMYIAAVFKGEVGWKLRKELQDALREIDTNYSKILSKWSGQLDGLSGIDDILEKKFKELAPKETVERYERNKLMDQAVAEHIADIEPAQADGRAMPPKAIPVEGPPPGSGGEGISPPEAKAAPVPAEAQPKEGEPTQSLDSAQPSGQPTAPTPPIQPTQQAGAAVTAEPSEAEEGVAPIPPITENVKITTPQSVPDLDSGESIDIQYHIGQKPNIPRALSVDEKSKLPKTGPLVEKSDQSIEES